MATTSRRIIALTSVVFLLLLQVAPAAAVCLCDLPDGESCCTNHGAPAPVEKPVVEEALGCCAPGAVAPGAAAVQEPAAEPEPGHCSGVRSADEGQVSLSPPACKSGLVTGEVSSAVVPLGLSSAKAQDTVTPAMLPALPPVIGPSVAATCGQLRGPPDSTGPPGAARNAPLLL